MKSDQKTKIDVQEAKVEEAREGINFPEQISSYHFTELI